MNIILDNINWLAVIIATILSFMLGAVWYSKILFLTPWMKGLGTPAVGKEGRPLWLIFIPQIIGTFLFAWVLFVSYSYSFAFAAIIALAVAVLIKANGLFAGKSYAAVAVEGSYVITQAAIILIVYSFFI